MSIVCEKTGYRADIEFKLKVGGQEWENACHRVAKIFGLDCTGHVQLFVQLHQL